ncbi:PREDICTED: GBF-interacting protein 1-like isoform X2 [Ipomoea nil]|uniref:GBF-interacting protein 1-like isoform X2 n=1 Tax=Ipomoea nil TaxID=35883 RepID=UPI0009017086|nr:PREDICTED: GBF-interacting protein 1-like isoform X2 [Ipomoea nil]
MSGGARVSIPANLRKTIQDIKEIAGDHSDEDILAVLKECKMDPNETAQKLLYLDTFHEVKRKRDRRKLNTNNRSAEEYKWTPGMQRRGGRGGRGNYSSAYVSDDAGRRKQMNYRQENGVRYSTERNARGSLPVNTRSEKNAAHLVKSASASATGPATSNGNSNHGSLTQVAAKRASDASITSVVDVNKFSKMPVTLKQLRYLNPGPTPTSTPTFSPGRVKDENSESIPSDLIISLASASASGVYSSASDPVLMPSLNPRNPGAVGTIKREIGTQRIANEAQSESNVNVQGIMKNGHPASGIVNSTNKIRPTESQEVRKSRFAESSKPLPLIQDEPQAIINNSESGHSEQVLASKGGTVASESPISSLPKLNDNVSTEQLNMKLEKLKISGHQPVILPDHLQVPEALKTGLTFGSLEAPMEQSMNSSNDKPPAPVVDQTSREPSMSHQAPSLTAQEVAHPDNAESHQHVSENVPPVEDNTSSGAAKTFDQPKQEGGNSQAQSTSASTPPVSQPMGIGQSPVAVSPQLFPFLRQPYASNYFPYNPYLPPFYMPQSAHQFIGPSGFAQQPSTANIYMPPPSTGVKFPVPPLYKPAAITGNLAHYGVPTGYSSYGSSVGYGSSEAPASGGSTSSEELAAAQMNEKNIYSTLKQNEEPHVWTSATGRDLSMLPQANYFYNLPQAQQMAFPPGHSTHGSFPGIYHPSQSVATPSNIQSLPQQTQAVGGSVDALPPSGAHQQLQPQMNWNSTFLNRENI